MKATLFVFLLALTATLCHAQAGTAADTPATDGAALQLAALDPPSARSGHPADVGALRPEGDTSPLVRHRTALGLGTALLLALGLVAYRQRPARRPLARARPTAGSTRGALVPIRNAPRSAPPTVCEGFMLSQFTEVRTLPDAPEADPIHFDRELRRARPSARKPSPAQRARRQALRPQAQHRHLSSPR